jgi:hypothetical protein
VKPSELASAICSATSCNYIATEVFYHLWGKENGFTAARIGDHWLLEHKPSGFMVDVKASNNPDFKAAVSTSFPNIPSKRAQTIIAGIKHAVTLDQS